MNNLLTLREAAGVLRLSLKTVQRLVRSGRLPASKLASRWRVSEADVEGFYATNRKARS